MHGAVNSDILNMPDLARVPQKLALSENRAGSNDPIRLALNKHEHVVRIRSLFQRLELSFVRLGA